MVKQHELNLESEIAAESAAQVSSQRARAQPKQIAVGDRIPSVQLSCIQEDGSTHYFKTDEVLKGRRALLFTVPGAFTPTCSNIHAAGYLDQIEQYKKLGVDVICVCPNNRFVAKGWDDTLKAKHRQDRGWVEYFPDWGCDFLFKMGLGADLAIGPNASTPVQLGYVAKRSALLIDNGVVKAIHVEANPGICEISGAASMLKEAQKLFGKK